MSPTLSLIIMFLINESQSPPEATTFERVLPSKGGLNGRKDTMTLSTIPATKPRHSFMMMSPRHSVDRSLNTKDIPGAFVSPRWEKFALRRPPLPEVDGSTPANHYPPVGRRPQNLSLTTADIEFCQSRASAGNMKTPRMLNPLAPRYSFAASEAPPAPRPRGRETGPDPALYNGDIELSWPRPQIPLDRPARDGFLKPSLPNNPKYGRQGFSQSLEAKDVNYPWPPIGQRPGFFGDRPLEVGGPLDPDYRVAVAPGCTSLAQVWEEERAAEENGSLPKAPKALLTPIGEVSGSRPGNAGIRDNGEAQLSLVTQDLTGASPQQYVGHCPWTMKGNSNGKPRFYEPWDIPGAQADTIPHGPKGTRMVKKAEPIVRM